MAEPAGAVSPDELPDKLYFRIKEASQLVGVPAYVLRYWESEFPQVSPRKSGRDHRLYRRKDIETLLEIKRLLYGERFTIEGARKALETRAPAPPPRQAELFPSAEPASPLGEIRIQLLEILRLLDR